MTKELLFKIGFVSIYKREHKQFPYIIEARDTTRRLETMEEAITLATWLARY